MKNAHLILWEDLLDLGFNSFLSFSSTKKKSVKKALEELRRALVKESEEHWHSLCKIFKKIKV